MNAQTLDSWRHRWRQEGLVEPATSKAPEEGSAAGKLAAASGPTVPGGPWVRVIPFPLDEWVFVVGGLVVRSGHR